MAAGKPTGAAMAPPGYPPTGMGASTTGGRQATAPWGMPFGDTGQQGQHGQQVTGLRPGRSVVRRGVGQPWVTWAMIVLCVVMYALQWITSGQSNGVTERFWYAGLYTSAEAMEPWRMITAAFLHSVGNPLHIVLNLYTLWLMGRVLEPVLGRPRFLALYLISAFGGSVAVLLLANPFVPVVGASGAVYGLFAALFLVMRSRGGKVTSIAALIGVNLVISFLPGANISWQGHIGGLVAGAACAAALTYLPGGVGRPYRPGAARGQAAFPWLGLFGVLAVLVVLAVMGSLRLTDAALLEYMVNRG